MSNIRPFYDAAAGERIEFTIVAEDQAAPWFPST
jgi:hypothetical protein